MDEAGWVRGWTFEELLELDGLGPIERPDRNRCKQDDDEPTRPGNTCNPGYDNPRYADLNRPCSWGRHRWYNWQWQDYAGLWAPIRDVAGQHGYKARNLYRYVENGRLPAILCPRCSRGFKKLIPNDPEWIDEAAASARFDKLAYLARKRRQDWREAQRHKAVQP